MSLDSSISIQATNFVDKNCSVKLSIPQFRPKEALQYTSYLSQNNLASYQLSCEITLLSPPTLNNTSLLLSSQDSTLLKQDMLQEQSFDQKMGTCGVIKEKMAPFVKKAMKNRQKVEKLMANYGVTLSEEDWEKLVRFADIAESQPEQKETNPHAKTWDRLIEEANEKSPGHRVHQLPEKEREKVLEKEWLILDPLTGICTGLAIEFVLNKELQGECNQMEPSDNARYWEKLLLPIMCDILEKEGLDDPEELNQNYHFDVTYETMIQNIGTKAHLEGKIIERHLPLNQFQNCIANKQGHQLLCLEKPGGRGVASNHMVYLNPSDRVIADGSQGSIIRVPSEYNFSEFVSYYIHKTYADEYDHFCLIQVSKDPAQHTVRHPSLWDKLQLSANIVSLKVRSFIYSDFSTFNQHYEKTAFLPPLDLKC